MGTSSTRIAVTKRYGVQGMKRRGFDSVRAEAQSAFGDDYLAFLHRRERRS